MSTIPSDNLGYHGIQQHRGVWILGIYKNGSGTLTLGTTASTEITAYNYYRRDPWYGELLNRPALAIAVVGLIDLRPDSPCLNAGYDAAVSAGPWISTARRAYSAHMLIRSR